MRLGILENGLRPVQKVILAVFKTLSGGLVPGPPPCAFLPTWAVREISREVLPGRDARGDRVVCVGSRVLRGLRIEAQLVPVLNERPHRSCGGRYGDGRRRSSGPRGLAHGSGG